LGVPFAFMLPGSIINVGIYYGSLIDGFIGTILSAISLYLPCFLALCGILPQWRYYRDKPGIQRLSIGITCVTSGLCFSVVHIYSTIGGSCLIIHSENRHINDFMHIHRMFIFKSWLASISIYDYIIRWIFSKC
jgi:hypothetical protein